MAEAAEVKKPLKTVLLAVDGSANSNRAFNFYLESLHMKDDFVVVLTIPEIPQIPIGPYPYPYPSDYFEEWKNTVTKMDNESKELLKTCGAKLKSKFPDIQIKLIKETGPRPGEIICKNAKQEDAKLIILGSRGLGVVRRTLLGSVSSYVVHHTHAVVTVVPN